MCIMFINVKLIIEYMVNIGIGTSVIIAVSPAKFIYGSIHPSLYLFNCLSICLSVFLSLSVYYM